MKSDDRSFAVAIPVWQQKLTAEEIRRVDNTHKCRGGASLFFVGPQSMGYDFYLDTWPDAQIMTFRDSNFAGTRQYSDWLITPELYEHFMDYDHLLIAQTDAFLIEELNWRNYDFDYCGAPWITPWVVGWDPVRRGLIHSRLSWRTRSLTVGNGGLSLRRPRAFVEFTKQLPKMGIYKNEDIVISYFGPRRGLTVAETETAEMIFMEDGAASWKPGQDIPQVKGFHSLNIINPRLEKYLLGPKEGAKE